MVNLDTQERIKIIEMAWEFAKKHSGQPTGKYSGKDEIELFDSAYNRLITIITNKKTDKS